MWKPGGKVHQAQKTKLQRVQGRNIPGILRRVRRPLWLDGSDQRRVREDEIRESSGGLDHGGCGGHNKNVAFYSH